MEECSNSLEYALFFRDEDLTFTVYPCFNFTNIFYCQVAGKNKRVVLQSPQYTCITPIKKSFVASRQLSIPNYIYTDKQG